MLKEILEQLKQEPKDLYKVKKIWFWQFQTPSSQAMLNATNEIPILITAVTDPKAVGLVGKNLSGTTDMPPMGKTSGTYKKTFTKC